MKTFNELSNLLYYLNNETPIGSEDHHIYYDPFPKDFDFDRDENTPPFYISECMEDDAHIPKTAILLGVGPLEVNACIEKLLISFYKKSK